MKKAIVGSRVRLSGKFLRSTGLVVGQKNWTVVACDCGLCRSGNHCAVNEPHHCQTNPAGYEDIAAEDRPKYRHIHIANLVACSDWPDIGWRAGDSILLLYCIGPGNCNVQDLFLL